MKKDIPKALIDDGLKTVVKKLEAMGWSYEPLYHDDGEIMTYSFKLPDKFDKDSYLEVQIEDHHNGVDVDDWIIYSSYYDPDNKNWFGEQMDDIPGTVAYEAMKLFVTFIDILKIERERGKLDGYDIER